MALRGLNFAAYLRRSLCQPAVRFLRTNKQAREEEWEADLDSGGAYAADETYETKKFGAVRRDKENLPHRHGEFEHSTQERPLIGFDVPIPKSYVREAEEAETRVKSQTTKKLKKERDLERRGRKEEAVKKNIEFKTVKKHLESDAEFYGASEGEVKSAFDAVKSELQKKDGPPPDEKKDSFGYRILKAEIRPRIWTMPKDEAFKCLMRNVLFDSAELFVLNKPYGLSMHGGGNLEPDDKMSLTSYLEDFAKAFKVDKVYPVHRLDRDATGVLCIAKSKEIADTIKAMFKARQISKEYIAITRGVPPMSEGIIEKHIAEGTIEGRRRMVIVPTAVPGSNKSVPKFHKTFPAVTKYKVMTASTHAAFVRLWPQTGYTHQLRVHLGFELNCPILGDHKYTHKRKLEHQKLPGAMLEKLKVRQQKVRDIPLHLHSRHLAIPGILEGGRNLLVKSPVPEYFKKNLERLGIRSF